MADVRSDSRICIQAPGGKIKTVICEEDYERNGYKAAGWTVVKEDWTKSRVVKPPIDISKEMGLAQLAEGAHKKR
jgi:hypothetical protein